MKYMKLVLPIIFVFLSACSSKSINEIRAQYEINFGIFSDRNSPPIEFIQETETIPWKKGVHEPLFGALVSQTSGGKFNISYEVYSVNPETNLRRVVEISPVWFVKDAIISPDFKQGVKFGQYEFAIYVQDLKKPISVIPFEMVPFKG